MTPEFLITTLIAVVSLFIAMVGFLNKRSRQQIDDNADDLEDVNRRMDAVTTAVNVNITKLAVVDNKLENTLNQLKRIDDKLDRLLK